MGATNPPTRPPTAAELLNDPVVLQAIEQAWIDSLANDPAQRHEEGGWIYIDLKTGDLLIKRAPRGGQFAIDLDNPPAVAGSVVVGIFHTHPNPSAEGWTTGPSASDQACDTRDGIPDLIRADDGVHLSGPPSRRGGLAGGSAYPP
jgi:hypothetical protein